MYMIRGSWDMLHLFCGCHGELKELKIETSPKGILYVCKEKEGEIQCPTRITTEDYEEILSHISNLIVEAELRGEMANLTYTTWKTKKGVHCRVLLHQDDKINIMVDNRKKHR